VHRHRLDHDHACPANGALAVIAEVAFARQAFNDAVMTYNTARQTVPTNIVANAFRFEEAEFFEIDRDEEREAPRVSFG